jgi:deoxyribose-phosphate aldolase
MAEQVTVDTAMAESGRLRHHESDELGLEGEERGTMTSTDLAVASDRARELIGGESDDATLRRFLYGLPGVDAVGLTQRAAGLGTRSIKTTSKAWALDKIISLIDLTTLEGADTPGKVRSLVSKAVHPDASPSDGPLPPCPQVAAVCVYGDMVPHAVEALGARHGDPDDGLVSVAAVATAFPSGRASLAVKLADTADAVAAGADEIDMVIDRGAFLAGNYGKVFDEIVQVKEACVRPDGTSASLKVILETGELNTYDNVKRASWLAILAGGDFIKTSTGKVSPAATLPVTLLMLEVVRDWHRLTGEKIGVKPAGGIRTAKDAVKYLVTVAETAGEEWLQPHLFRYGASSLLNDVLRQRQKLASGHYTGIDYVTID